jgi:hypothetical protein
MSVDKTETKPHSRKDTPMHRFLLLAATTFIAGPALADITVTNDRGASAVITRDCDRSDGTATCTVQGEYTGANGKTASKTRVRTAERGFVSTEVAVTGPDGNTRTRERSWSRND